jgi:uncharacterized protein involved in type VI secretion and phage assembly
MTLLDHDADALHRAPGARWFGVYVALVTDIQDPDGQGRVKVSLPWSPDTAGANYEAWARVATLMAGSKRGTWFIPDVGDEVLVGFDGGDASWPFVLGALWNGKDEPPQSIDADNNKKVICSRNGVKITLDDQQGQESLRVETPGGQQLTLKDGPGSIEIADSNGNSVKLEAAGVTVTAASKATINAATAEITAATLTVNAGMTTFSGVVQASTVIASSIIGSSYTPGAGNIW